MYLQAQLGGLNGQGSRGLAHVVLSPGIGVVVVRESSFGDAHGQHGGILGPDLVEFGQAGENFFEGGRLGGAAAHQEAPRLLAEAGGRRRGGGKNLVQCLGGHRPGSVGAGTPALGQYGQNGDFEGENVGGIGHKGQKNGDWKAS
ncbi:MAG: hypothetical protein NVS3B25_22210 [Hymenobacter sp.]